MFQTILKAIIVAVATNTVAMPSANESDLSDENKIRNTRERSNEAIARQDVDAIVSFLNSTYQVTAGSGELIQSRDLMGVTFSNTFAKYKDATYVRTPETIVISTYNSLASETGTWVGTWTTLEGSVRMGGTYSASWHKEAQSWKIRSELFVTLFCEGAGC